jgi:uncharacterized protein HemX
MQVAKPFIEAGLALLGIGSAVSIGVLTWHLKNNRRDIQNHQATETSLRSAAKNASDAREQAEQRERTATSNLSSAMAQLAQLRGPLDEQQARAQREIAKLSAKIDLLRTTSRGDGAEFWSRPADTVHRPPLCCSLFVLSELHPSDAARKLRERKPPSFRQVA